jgi:hypothetical protein
MSTPSVDDDDKLDPEAARMIARVRSLMLIAGLTTMLAIAAVLAVIGYRVFTLQGSAPLPAGAVIEVTANLPKGARIVSTAAASDRIVVTVEIGGMTEIHTFDLHSLKAVGRLQFKPEP